MASFDPRRRELLRLSAMTGGAISIGDIWPEAADAAEATTVPAHIDVRLLINGD